MKIVGITGSIGCGKTTLAKIANKLGYAVYDIDGWVRRIYRNKIFLTELDKIFPGSVVNNNADKKFLRNIVFGDKNKLNQLENIIYPRLNKNIRNVIRKNSRRQYLVFLDAALLFEKGWDKYCQAIILADVDCEIQKKRVMKRDKISAEEFDRINNIQLKNKDKKVLSDIVIDTDASINMLRKYMITAIKELEEFNG